MDYLVQLTSSFSWPPIKHRTFPEWLTPHSQLHFVLGTIISLLIQYQPLARLFTSKGTPRSPGRALEVTLEIHVVMVHLAPADCRLYVGPANQKLVSTESSLHALLQRCGLTRFSQIIKGWREWVSRYQKTISGRDKSKKQRVTSIFAWVFITPRAEKKRSVALGCITILLQKGTTVPLPQTQVPTYSPHLMLYNQFIHSSAPSLLFAFLHASFHCKSASVILRFPFKMQSDKFPR